MRIVQRDYTATSQEEIDLKYNIAFNVPDREHWIEWYGQEKFMMEAGILER